VCRQIDERVFRDLLVVDKQFFEDGDAKKSGVEKVRDLLPVWGQPAHGSGTRVTILVEAQDLHPSVSNLLLKTLEEPRPGNAFVLLAPQRERLLQTLVSRSFVLTLPWPQASLAEPDAQDWVRAMLHLWDTGQGWFERTGTKGAADRPLALRILALCQSELCQALMHGAAAPSAVAKRLARLGPAGLRRFDLVLAAAQDALNQPTVMPALVLDWMATCMAPGVVPKSAASAPRPGPALADGKAAR
jgi:DNA polymerase-3 subunit delta'